MVEMDGLGLKPLLHFLIVVVLQMLWTYILQGDMPQSRLQVASYQHLIGIEGDLP